MRITHLLCSWAGVCAATLALAAVPSASGQSSQAAITLATGTTATTEACAGLIPLPQDVRLFGSASVGQSSERESFTLNFNQTTRITGISATADFHLNGGTCIEGHTYSAGNVCSVDLVFTPQGPGHRTGKLLVAHTASAQPFIVPTGGEGLGPVVSFVPSEIVTVPGTAPTMASALMDPQALAIDGGDNLYIADTFNHLIRYRDSSGVLTVLAGGGSNASGTYSGAPTGVKLSFPYGVAPDGSGGVYIADQGNNVVRYLRYDQTLLTAAGGGSNSGSCSVSSPCADNTVALPYPYSVAVDASNNLFINVNNGGSSALPIKDTRSMFGPGSLAYLTVGIGSTWNYPIAVDWSDNLYYTRGVSSTSGYSACTIVAQNQTFGNPLGGPSSIWRVAGTNICGFSGDGGLATGAEISTLVEGFAWDAANNFYFTDSGNNRVRRIDALTGIIRTIAGDGSGAYFGDGGPATTASLKMPKGIAVDSFGNVYATSQVGLSGNTNTSVVREIGMMGYLNFASQAPMTSSAPQTIMVSNVGNSALNFTHEAFTSGNTGDFAIDPNTTSCNFTVPLQSGRNCFIGIIFTPGATGNRSAVLTLLDDTVTGSNTIQLNGLSFMPATATLSGTSLVFPLQAVGTTSSSMSVTLSNNGGQSLTINSYTMSGPNAGSFAQTHSCPSTMLLNTGCTIFVTFSPTVPGSPTATLSISTSVGTVTVALSGTSATPATATLSPTTLTFAAQGIHTSSAPQQVTLNNTGGMPLTINSFTFTGGNPTYFTQTNSCLGTMPGPSGCSIYVTFSPTATGSPTSTLSISTSAGTVTVSVAGTSIFPATAILSTNALTFPLVQVSTNGISLPLTLSNTGGGTLTINSFTITGPQAVEFSSNNNCHATLASTASCGVSVLFSPTSPGAASAVLSISTSVGTVTVNLSGTGATPATAILAPTTLTFPSQTVGTSSAAQLVTLSNTGGMPLAINSYTYAGTNPTAFPQINTCGASLPGASSCSIFVAFTPTAAGSPTASLSVNTSAGTSSVKLLGTSVAAAGPATAILSKSALVFPLQANGTASDPLPVALSNTGGQTLTITSYTITGPNAANFTSTHTCAATLGAGTLCTVKVVYSQAATGSSTGTMSIVTSAGTVSFTLSGSSTTPAVALRDNTPLAFPLIANGTTGQIVTFVQNIAVPGSMPLIISSCTFTGANPTVFGTTLCAGIGLASSSTVVILVTFSPTTTGTYSATLSINTSVGPLTVPVSGSSNVAGMGTSITLDSAANPVIQGRLVTFRSQVTSVSSVAPTGVVQLREGSIVLGQASLSAGSATFTLPRLATGQHTLTAWYLGDSMHAPSESPSISQSVVAPPRPLLP